MKFNGFNSETLLFFQKLKENNSKEWFQANKKIYDNTIKPLSKSLVEDMGNIFAEAGLTYIADSKISLFRINRDIRFSIDKSPYKTHFGVFFPYSSTSPNKKPINSAGLYFHFEPDNFFIAGGLHSPEPDVLKSIREKIASDFDKLDMIVNNKNFITAFPKGLYGEQLKNAPKGYDINHPAIKYLKYKQYLVDYTIENEDVFSAKLTEKLLLAGIAIAPLLEFLSDSIDND